MTQKVFVTGTDTDVGKTLVSVALLQCWRKLGRSTCAYKPISAGCEATKDGLRNQDALQLQAVISEDLDYEWVNPIAYADPVAPHLAAARMGQTIDRHDVTAGLARLLALDTDVVLVEGAGGWLLPLDSSATLADWAGEQQMQVILVVGMKLGCLNHALLSMQSIQASGCKVVGWVANQIDPDMAYLSENIETLKAWLNVPLIGCIPYLCESEKHRAAEFLDLSVLDALS